MSESLSSASEKSGLPPGSLVHVGEVHKHEHKITVIDYNKSTLTRRTIKNIEELPPYQTTDTVTWVIIDGLKDVSIIDAIGQHFDIHALVLEDILNTHQRPKFEEFDDYLYIVIKAISLAADEFNIEYEQVSLLLLDKFVFTFKEKPDALFDPIFSRLNNDKSHLRNLGADYLTYIIMDTIVDEYFSLQDTFDELIESVEDELLNNPSAQTLNTIQKIKRELIFLRRSVSPLRELLAAVQRSESPLLNEKTKRYFRDIYDHVIRVSEAMESYRDLIAGMLDIYLSSVSNKMNETMKILTVFASIFIPLTFIAGVYGMNFAYMPELQWKWGYPALWGVFIGVSVFLLRFFKKKKWI
ncbi:magnesium/cobalt transporter CorA [Candidatus Methylobacter oryzae]|uniref:Magnesium transport protein CorA n=1 Tax=Candidatus Methylobacter oryzae TaxID=2497749 RepID=A0ABY3CGL4_9GAMM|nr:magnesium/cobalt transporter CorA [Candidatus Methylobacter oryzae]TRX03029.1 magnesium/cobalt transporter CorA [Candidatus Methylobacter oryzae]